MYGSKKVSTNTMWLYTHYTLLETLKVYHQIVIIVLFKQQRAYNNGTAHDFTAGISSTTLML